MSHRIAELVFGVAMEVVGLSQEEINRYPDQGVVGDGLFPAAAGPGKATSQPRQLVGLVPAETGFLAHEGLPPRNINASGRSWSVTL